MKATRAPDLSIPLMTSCLHPGAPLECAQGAPGFLRPHGRSFWPARRDALHLLQDTLDPHSVRPGWDPKILGTPGPPLPASTSWNPQAPARRRSCCHRLGLAEPPEVPPNQRRPRKQAHPQRAPEREDPGFKGVSLRFQIQPDSGLRILPSYSLSSSSSRPQGPRPEPPRSPPTPPPGPGGSSEALGPRRCASCRTQRTPLWRDAEDGTPLCNACGIRYKKYGTRCSSCWLVPRKNLQPKRFCGRCGIPLGPHPDG